LLYFVTKLSVSLCVFRAPLHLPASANSSIDAPVWSDIIPGESMHFHT
jgi:hypothetical protein